MTPIVAGMHDAPLDAERRVRSHFTEQFGHDPSVVARSPGRVNLIGEHTDYNDGFVLPMGLPHATWFAVEPRDDRVVVLHSEGFGSTRFDIDQVEPGKPIDGWGVHVAGTLWALREAGVPLRGFQGTVATDVPVGASLSSSAALEVAAARAALAISEQPFDPTAAALAGQRAEGDFLGLPSGIMDQLVSAVAIADHAVLIDCADLSVRPVLVPTSATVVILDTMSRRELAESEYGKRRADCEAATAVLGVDSLRTATLEMVEAHAEELGERVADRARHVVTEIARTEQAADDLESADLDAFGHAMDASHASLRDLYEVSGPELDTMVDIAQSAPGVYGARMTGGGFAGAAVALVDTDRIEEFTADVVARFTDQTGVTPTLYVVRPGPGASLV